MIILARVGHDYCNQSNDHIAHPQLYKKAIHRLRRQEQEQQAGAGTSEFRLVLMPAAPAPDLNLSNLCNLWMAFAADGFDLDDGRNDLSNTALKFAVVSDWCAHRYVRCIDRSDAKRD